MHKITNKLRSQDIQHKEDELKGTITFTASEVCRQKLRTDFSNSFTRCPASLGVKGSNFQLLL